MRKRDGWCVGYVIGDTFSKLYDVGLDQWCDNKVFDKGAGSGNEMTDKQVLVAHDKLGWTIAMESGYLISNELLLTKLTNKC